MRCELHLQPKNDGQERQPNRTRPHEQRQDKQISWETKKKMGRRNQRFLETRRIWRIQRKWFEKLWHMDWIKEHSDPSHPLLIWFIAVLPYRFCLGVPVMASACSVSYNHVKAGTECDEFPVLFKAVETHTWRKCNMAEMRLRMKLSTTMETGLTRCILLIADETSELRKFYMTENDGQWVRQWRRVRRGEQHFPYRQWTFRTVRYARNNAVSCLASNLAGDSQLPTRYLHCSVQLCGMEWFGCLIGSLTFLFIPPRIQRQYWPMLSVHKSPDHITHGWLLRSSG